MARFLFKLEPLLRYRQNLEDEAQRNLAMHLRQRMILLDQLRRMQQTISQSRRDMAGGLVGRLDLERVSQFARYSGQVTQRAHDMVRRVAMLEKQIGIAQEKLRQAQRDRKAIELLRDRQQQQWTARQQRLETEALDELAQQAAVRRGLMEMPL